MSARMHIVPSPYRDRNTAPDQRHVESSRMISHVDRIRRAKPRVDSDSPLAWSHALGSAYRHTEGPPLRTQQRLATLRQRSVQYGVGYDIEDRPKSPPRPASAGIIRTRVKVAAPVAVRAADGTIARADGRPAGRDAGDRVSAVRMSPEYKAFISLLAQLTDAEATHVVEAAHTAAYEERLLAQFGRAM
jgi:hypothetical protein